MTQQTKRKLLYCIFIFYVLFVIKAVILKYPYEQLVRITRTWTREVVLEGLDTANFTLFKTIRMYIRYADRLNSIENLVGNVVVFIPLGLMLPILWEPCRCFLETFMLSFIAISGIELFQLFSAFGAFDVDDILLNSIGAAAGYVIYRAGRAVLDKRSGGRAQSQDLEH